MNVVRESLMGRRRNSELTEAVQQQRERQEAAPKSSPKRAPTRLHGAGGSLGGKYSEGRLRGFCLAMEEEERVGEWRQNLSERSAVRSPPEAPAEPSTEAGSTSVLPQVVGRVGADK
jgi:hypothetical protein